MLLHQSFDDLKAQPKAAVRHIIGRFTLDKAIE